TALEPHDAFSLFRETHEQLVDFALPARIICAAALPDVVQLDGHIAFDGRREREERWIRERVVDDGVACDEQLATPEREQAWISGAGPDEKYDPLGRSSRCRA